MINIFWFRRDLRLEDNHGLFRVLNAGLPVLPVFIFDSSILRSLPRDDARVSYIHQCLQRINKQLTHHGSGVDVRRGRVMEVWSELLAEYEIDSVYTNRDYEPYAKARDHAVMQLLASRGVGFLTFKDQVIFERHDVLKPEGKPYTVFTPYKNKWKEQFNESMLQAFPSEQLLGRLMQSKHHLPALDDLGFTKSALVIQRFDASCIGDYDKHRDFPGEDKTSRLGVHIRFGAVSVRHVMRLAASQNEVFLSELIWREFFMMILYHFPFVVNKSFKSKYDDMEWINNERQFDAWCRGQTGYPLVDAGMRQLNQTGFMHNRVRMVTASFLCKHLLIDWCWGESYFARKLLDFDLSANNGNWQWAAGCGCDAAPYFRVFNPAAQLEKFDAELKYTRKWVPEYGQLDYPLPIVEHTMARNRAIKRYKQALTAG